MSTITQTLESIGKAADIFGDMKEKKFSFTIKTSSDGQVRFVNPSFDEFPLDLALCIVGALSQAKKSITIKLNNNGQEHLYFRVLQTRRKNRKTN